MKKIFQFREGLSTALIMNQILILPYNPISYVTVHARYHKIPAYISDTT